MKKSDKGTTRLTSKLALEKQTDQGFDIYFAATEKGQYLAEEFMDGLEEHIRNKILRIIDRLSRSPVVGNEQKFKKIKGTDLWEIKDFQTRILCFLYKSGLYLTHGLTKKTDRLPRPELKKANRIRSIFLSDQ